MHPTARNGITSNERHPINCLGRALLKLLLSYQITDSSYTIQPFIKNLNCCKFITNYVVHSNGWGLGLNPRNTNWRGRLSTVYLLNKIVCFVKKQTIFLIVKWADPKRRSTVLNLPLQCLRTNITMEVSCFIALGNLDLTQMGLWPKDKLRVVSANTRLGWKWLLATPILALCTMVLQMLCSTALSKK